MSAPTRGGSHAQGLKIIGPSPARGFSAIRAIFFRMLIARHRRRSRTSFCSRVASKASSGLLARNLFALCASLRKPYRNRLFFAFDGLAGLAALERSSLTALHGALHSPVRTWNIEPSFLSFFRIRKNADSLRKFRRNKRRRPTSLRDDSSTALRIEPNARVLAPKLCSVRAGSCTKRKPAGGTRANKWS
jgi:hypothetical protein